MQRKVVKVTDNPEQGARFESLMAALNVTQTSLAQILGISQSYVSQLAGGSRNISRRVLHFITKNYPEVNINWLLTGEGEMFLGRKEVIAERLAVVEESVSPKYEKGVGGAGVLESALHRLSALEDKVAEMEERLRAVEEGRNE